MVLLALLASLSSALSSADSGTPSERTDVRLTPKHALVEAELVLWQGVFCGSPLAPIRRGPIVLADRSPAPSPPCGPFGGFVHEGTHSLGHVSGGESGGGIAGLELFIVTSDVGLLFNSDGVPQLSRSEDPAIPALVTRWRLTPSVVTAIVDESFPVRIEGWLDDDCEPRFQETDVLREESRVRITFDRGVHLCNAVPRYFWQRTIEVPGLAAGRYLIDVDFEVTPSRFETAARTELLSVPGDRARLETLHLELDDADRAIVTGGIFVPDCDAESFTMGETRVLGRDIVLQFERSPDTTGCVGSETQSFSQTLGFLDQGHYRVIAEQLDPGVPPKFLAQSPLIELRPTTAPFRSAQHGLERFRARVEWLDYEGRTGEGFLASENDESLVFAFFDESNWELMVKVLDGCALNDHYWVFGSASTDVAYTLTVIDTVSGETRSFENHLGHRSPAITDTQAFECTGP